MKLTRRQREILEGLRQAETDPQCRYDLVESEGQVWFGDQRTNHATLLFFLCHSLVSPENQPWEGAIYYGINEWGKRALDEPDFSPRAELGRSRRLGWRARPG